MPFIILCFALHPACPVVKRASDLAAVQALHLVVPDRVPPSQ